MIWFEKEYDINDTPVMLMGTFEDSELKITATIKVKGMPEPKFVISEMYNKTINMWVHQDILAEDILAKYQGMVKKCEKKLSVLVKKHKINESI